jgi:hypothetical protein
MSTPAPPPAKSPTDQDFSQAASSSSNPVRGLARLLSRASGEGVASDLLEARVVLPCFEVDVTEKEVAIVHLHSAEEV